MAKQTQTAPTDETAPTTAGDTDSGDNGSGDDTTKRTRNTVAKRVYITDDGKEAGRNAPTNAASLEFRFVNGEVRAINVDDFEAHVQRQATWHGFNQKLGDAFASAKGDVAAAIEAFDETYDQLKEGDWVTAAEGGGVRTTYLIEALARLRARRDGDDPATHLDFYKEKVAGMTDEQRKANSANPAVAAELAQIASEKAAERARKAAEAAGTSTTGLDDILG